MADYEFKYRLENAPTATRDGSGMVKHRIIAIARVEGSADEWVEVPGRRKDIAVPGADLSAVLAGPQVVTNYKNLLVANLNTGVEPIAGWDLVSLEAMLDANDIAEAAATEANDYITITLGLLYPVDFSL
jgi:hypothetical protein